MKESDELEFFTFLNVLIESFGRGDYFIEIILTFGCTFWYLGYFEHSVRLRSLLNLR